MRKALVELYMGVFFARKAESRVCVDIGEAGIR